MEVKAKDISPRNVFDLAELTLTLSYDEALVLYIITLNIAGVPGAGTPRGVTENLQRALETLGLDPNSYDRRSVGDQISLPPSFATLRP